MQLQGRNLKLDMRGADVRLLQFELGLLGLEVANDETYKNHFGQSTQHAVRTFQEKAQLEQTGKVDPKTARHLNAQILQRVQPDKAVTQLGEAVNDAQSQIASLDANSPDVRAHIERLSEALKAFAMALEGLRQTDARDELVARVAEMLSAGQAKLKELAESLNGGEDDHDTLPYVVRGRVTQRDGAPIAAARLRALEKQVVAARTRTLGATRTGEDGAYEIQYRVQKGAQPDLMVEVVDPQGNMVVTRSPLVVDAVADQIVDLVVDSSDYPPASEFDQIRARLVPLLQGVALDQVDSDSVSYLTGKTGISPVRISSFLQAHRFAQEGEVPAQVYYGLFRTNLPPNKPALVAQDAKLLRSALRVASQSNVIDPKLAQEAGAINQAVTKLNSEMVDTLIKQPALPDGSASLGAFLEVAALNDAQKRTVVGHVQTHSGRGASFWASLAEEETMDDKALRSLQLTAQLGTLTLNNAPLMGTLHRRLADQAGTEPLRGAVGFSTEDWARLVRDHRDANGKVIVPQSFRNAQDPVGEYAKTMRRMVEDAYPTPSLAARLQRDSFEGAGVLIDFATAYPNFEFRDQSVPGYLRANQIGLPAEARAGLERVGRLFDLVPRFERDLTLQPLLAMGLDSAYQIRSMGERRFIARVGPSVGETQARQIYGAAAQKTAAASVLFSKYSSTLNNLWLSAIPQPDIPGLLGDLVIPGVETIDFPTWESMFGHLDVCDCEHCESIFSPSAYLVAILKYLRDRGAQGALFDRRPDIGKVELTCHNTHTPLPYIDLALEVLETYLVSGTETYQTEGEAPALRVHPEHINAEAYRLLEEERIYPWILPFSLWTEEARAYLTPLGVARHEIMDHFSATVAADRDVDDWLPIATERLGLTTATRTILLDGAFRNARWNGRSTAQLRTVQTLLDTARISFLELRQILGTRFVNGDGSLEIEYAGEGDDPEFVCDLEQARIDGLQQSHLNRLQRFVRLQRALGWSIHDLDVVLHALGDNLNKQTLLALAQVKELHERLDQPLPILASWVADLDTHDYLNDEDETASSLYASLFLNRSVGGDEELAPFELGALGAGSIDDHEAAILAALQIITAEELALIRDRRLGAGTDTLNLPNLSELHRVATLARALDLSVEELFDLLDLSGLDPFDVAHLRGALELVDLVDILAALDVSVAELNYLLRHAFDPNSPLVPSDTDIGRFLTDLRAGLSSIQEDLSAAPDPTGEITAQMLGIVLESGDLPQAVSLIYGLAAADELPTDPGAFLQAQLATFVADAGARATMVARLLDGAHPDYLQPELQQAERFALVLEPLAAHLRALHSETLVQQAFADFLEIDLDVSAALLGDLIRSVADPAQPASALFLDEGFITGAAEIEASAFADHYAMIYRLHKVALLIQRFDLPVEELAWLVDEHGTINWLDLNELPVTEAAGVSTPRVQWLNMARAALLRQAWPAGEPSLFELLRQAEAGGDAAALDAFLVALTSRTGWNRADVDTLLDGAHFDLDDFAEWGGEATLRHLWRLQANFESLRRLGVSADMAWGWARPEVTREIAGEVKQAARAKYTESQWLGVAEPIRDGLRQEQRDALVEAVIQQIDDPEIRNTNDLYAHLLMDAEINPCLLTSRMVFATGAVQLFVQRILLNLEEGISFSTEDAEMWQWMKNYRVWEANVKVFVTPENWIEPELRPEKSPFFKALEDELLQNEVTLETAELAYQDYLEKLDEVARLEVVGLYNETETKTLHVIARTKGTPGKYFYRQWFEARRWTAWQEVPLDIEAGTVTPVIYNRRLYLFWLTAQAKAEEETDDGNKPNRYLEIKLAWSQYRQRKWTPKRISNQWVETDRTRNQGSFVIQPDAYRPRPLIQPDGDLLIAVERTYGGAHSYLDSSYLKRPSNFLFINDGQVELVDYPDGFESLASPVEAGNSYAYAIAVPGDSALRVAGYDGSWQDLLDRAPHPYRVTLPLQYVDYNSSAPFFFEDRRRTYFVTPDHIFGFKPSVILGTGLYFPAVEVFLENYPKVPLPDVLGPLRPTEADTQALTPSLESVLHPETRTPPLEMTLTDTMAGIDDSVLAQPTLTVVQGGTRVIGGDVGVPLVGTQFTGANDTVLNRSLRAQPSAPLMQQVVLADPSLTSTYAAEEAYAANLIASVGLAEGILGFKIAPYQHTSYTFTPFYYAYANVLLKQLNRHGVDGILNPREHGEAHDLRRQLMQEGPSEAFDAIYEPGEDLNDDLLPVEMFDFEYGRPYSVYNWEMFFHIPFMIANHLSQNQRFDEARQWYHYIFDPTDNSDLVATEAPYRFWKVKPFFQNTDIQTIEQLMRLLSSDDPADLEMKARLEAQIEDWRRNPFQPHLIAEQRPVAYQKAIVMKYLDNEIAQGDYLFRQDTMESVFEAIQHYILAAQMLGRRPERIPAPEGDRIIDGHPVRTFDDLAPHLDAFGNALVRLETELSGAGACATGGGAAADGAGPEPPIHEIIGSTLFFCIPQNQKLLGYWDTVEDRLFKIRNCMNIEGVVRALDLFAPPIDPALLIRAAAAGVDLGAVLNDLGAPRPHYRFSVMVQKALDLATDVKALGSALLSALEKRDAEDLALLRQSHEQDLLGAVKQVRELQVDEAQETLAGLQKNLESAAERHDFFANRPRMIPNETLHLQLMETANMFDALAQGHALVGSALAAIPEFDVGAEGGLSSPVAKARFGGANLARIMSFMSQLHGFFASIQRQGAQRAQTLAGYDRRTEDWDFSADQAQIDVEALEKQVAASEIRIAIAEKELANHETQIEQAREVDDLMHQKFTNRDLYSWMVTQASTIYFQVYQLAYDIAKRAEKAFQHELADYDATFINFGYWDSLRKGLMAGERLHLDLRRMEAAYYERSKRDLELIKHVSLLRLDPAALVQLRETGSCEFAVPEAFFNLDFPGHYLRRIKTVALTIPGVTGPYTGVHATLTLLSNQIRTSTVDPHVPYQGVDDPHFLTNVGGVQAIATSSGQNDSGLFELNLRDERYLPFEGAGAIGRWRIELNDEYRAFDYDTISDVILHLNHTARDGGAAVRQQVVPALAERVDALINATEETGLYHYVSLAHEFGSELHRALHPTGTEDHTATLALRRDHFPYIFQGRPIEVQSAVLMLKLRDATLYDDAQPLAVELARAGGAAQSEDLQTAGTLLGGLPLAAYAHVGGEMAAEENWELHVTPAAVQALPAALRHTVEVDGTEVERLRAEEFEDMALLIRYTIS